MTVNPAVRKWVENGYCSDAEVSNHVQVRPEGHVEGRPVIANPGCYYYPHYTCFDCRSSDRDGGGRAKAIFALVLLIFSAIAAFFWSLAAVRNSLDHHDAYREAQGKNEKDASIIYEGMRNEQIAAATCRFMLAGGASLLIACAAFYCYYDGTSNPFYITLFMGSGLTGAGIMAYGIKYVAFRYKEETAAARRLVGLGSGLSTGAMYPNFGSFGLHSTAVPNTPPPPYNPNS